MEAPPRRAVSLHRPDATLFSHLDQARLDEPVGGPRVERGHGHAAGALRGARPRRRRRRQRGIGADHGEGGERRAPERVDSAGAGAALLTAAMADDDPPVALQTRPELEAQLVEYEGQLKQVWEEEGRKGEGGAGMRAPAPTAPPPTTGEIAAGGRPRQRGVHGAGGGAGGVARADARPAGRRGARGVGASSEAQVALGHGGGVGGAGARARACASRRRAATAAASL